MEDAVRTRIIWRNGYGQLRPTNRDIRNKKVAAVIILELRGYAATRARGELCPREDATCID